MFNLFVSYNGRMEKGNQYFGNSVLEVERIPRNMEDIRNIQKHISDIMLEDGIQVSNLIILSYQSML